MRAPILARILRYADRRAAALVAPRKLALFHVDPQTSLKTLTTTYRFLDAADRLKLTIDRHK